MEGAGGGVIWRGVGCWLILRVSSFESENDTKSILGLREILLLAYILSLEVTLLALDSEIRTLELSREDRQDSNAASTIVEQNDTPIITQLPEMLPDKFRADVRT